MSNDQLKKEAREELRKEMESGYKTVPEILEKYIDRATLAERKRASAFIRSLKDKSFSVSPNFDQYDEWAKEFEKGEKL